MKFLTSYFYQIRHFSKNMIPFSTAVFDPKWYHQYSDQSRRFIDARGIINGLRAEMLVPLSTTCRGPETCDSVPSHCSFLQEYRQQLERLEFEHVVQTLQKACELAKLTLGFNDEPIAVLIFHETPSNPCSERVVVRDWFKNHNYDIEEYSRMSQI